VKEKKTVKMRTQTGIHKYPQAYVGPILRRPIWEQQGDPEKSQNGSLSHAIFCCTCDKKVAAGPLILRSWRPSRESNPGSSPAQIVDRHRRERVPHGLSSGFLHKLPAPSTGKTVGEMLDRLPALKNFNLSENCA
jgi:hypothetical protein